MASHDSIQAPIPDINEESSRDPSTEPSNSASREGSRPPKKKHNVRFTPEGESLDTARQKAAFELRDDTNAPPKPKPRPRSRPKLDETIWERSNAVPSIKRFGKEKSQDITDETARAPVSQARPSIMRVPSSDSDARGRYKSVVDKGNKEAGSISEDEEDEIAPAKAFSQWSAQDRAERLSRRIGSHSAPGSRYTSPHRPLNAVARSPPPSPPSNSQGDLTIDLSSIPLEKLKSKRTKYGIEDDSDEEGEEEVDVEKKSPPKKKVKSRFISSAVRVVWRPQREKLKRSTIRAESPDIPSGAQTPVHERDPDHYVPKPSEYREGYLSSLLKLYDQEGIGSAISHIPAGPGGIARAIKRKNSGLPLLSSASIDGISGTPGQTPDQTPVTTPGGSPLSSGTSTPKQKHQKWYYKNPASQSTGALSDLISSSTVLAQPGSAKQSSVVRPKPKQRPLSQQAIETMRGRKKRAEEETVIRIHLSETLLRQRFLVKMCRALMSYGAPTHRLEEYMIMSARVLEINGQFLYIPGCMIISFDDMATHTADVKIVREAQGTANLGKLQDSHEVYKEVIHDVIGVEEAMERLDELKRSGLRHNHWMFVLFSGLCSLCVGPFAFGARPIDLPIIFLLGCLLGFLQHIVAPKSALYTNVFEISAAVITSFLARAFGSINDGGTFCFAALTQSAIALILPGYAVLCGSLELQTRNVVAGSVRMVYAIIYSLFLGYGITIGTSLYGGIDKNATSEVSCRSQMPIWWKFMFVPLFTYCICVLGQAKKKQMPFMIVIAFIGYIVNYFSALRFPTNAQIANTFGALAVGILGNLYSRLRHGLAATALIPAIYVQVPSGLAASGSLVSGITSANQITNQSNSENGTTTVGSAIGGGGPINSMVFNVGYSMIQIAIGITVGLFLSALVVYPLGKRRSGLFSF